MYVLRYLILDTTVYALFAVLLSPQLTRSLIESAHSSIYLTIYLSVYLSIYLSVYLSIYLSIYAPPFRSFATAPPPFSLRYTLHYIVHVYCVYI